MNEMLRYYFEGSSSFFGARALLSFRHKAIDSHELGREEGGNGYFEKGVSFATLILLFALYDV